MPQLMQGSAVILVRAVEVGLWRQMNFILGDGVVGPVLLIMEDRGPGVLKDSLGSFIGIPGDLPAIPFRNAVNLAGVEDV